jgi:hypothetical protein
MKKLYSTSQIYGGSFLGGPFAAIYFLKKNFDVIEQYDLSRKTLWLGLLGTFVLISILPFLPEKFPNLVIPIFYSTYASSLAAKHKFKKHEIISANIYELHSNWRVLIIAILAIVVFFAAAIPVFILFDHLGLTKIGWEG